MQVLPLGPSSIRQAAAVLRRGGVIIYPTDTAYGLGGIFNSPSVVNKILKIKNRKDKKFILVASSLAQVQKFFKLNQVQRKLARRYWPGALSIVVSARFAVRVPDQPAVKRLCRLVGKPIIATSANISGEQTSYSSQKIINDFRFRRHQPDLLLAAGKLPKKKTSTVVKAVKDDFIILRPGSVVF